MNRKLYWLAATAICVLITASAASAQARDEQESTMSQILDAFFGPNWNVYAHTGATTTGRYLLQDVGGGQRGLGTDVGYDFGIGGGVDILPRVGFRGSYTWAKNDLRFRTDNGDGSSNLDLDDIGTLKSNVVSLEAIRYMLPRREFFTPYGSVGFVGTWWVLDESTLEVLAPSGSTEFRFGGIASLGGQFRLTEHWATRIEMAWGGIRSPFAGKDSYVAPTGITIDEPTRVTKTDYRIVAMYDFSKSEEEKPRATTARRPNGRGTRSRP